MPMSVTELAGGLLAMSETWLCERQNWLMRRSGACSDLKCLAKICDNSDIDASKAAPQPLQVSPAVQSGASLLLKLVYSGSVAQALF